MKTTIVDDTEKIIEEQREKGIAYFIDFHNAALARKSTGSKCFKKISKEIAIEINNDSSKFGEIKFKDECTPCTFKQPTEE